MAPGERDGAAEGAVGDDRADHRPLAPEPVSEEADTGRADQHADEDARGEDSGLGRAEREGRDDARQREAHHVDVEAVEQMPEGSRHVHAPVLGSKIRLVEALKQLARICLDHLSQLVRGPCSS